MPSAQNAQSLPSFNVAHHSDHYKTILPNLSYPSRPNAHIPWSGSSAPLLFANTTRLETSIATSTPTVQVLTTATFDTRSVPDAFRGISLLIWHNLLMIVRKLKLIRQKLFGVRFTSPPTTPNV